jgi:phosphate transport system protein
LSNGEHLSKQYDQELESLRTRILHMGGMVEAQLQAAIASYERPDVKLAEEAIDADRSVNEQEVDLDRLVVNMIVRRQPTASDLRLIIGVARTVTELERIGDEATKIARAAKWLFDKQRSIRTPRLRDIHNSALAAARMLRGALDAFARLDAAAAASIIEEDRGVDQQFQAILRQLITFMMEDPRTISPSLDAVWVAKAIERVGDHAKNIAEHVIFVAQGADVRHASPEEIARAVLPQE